MKRKIVIAIVLLVCVALAVTCALAIRNKMSDTVVYEKDGNLYYDYVSDGDIGYAITVNVNNMAETSRTLISDNMQDIRYKSKGYDYKEQEICKGYMFMPKVLMDYFYTHERMWRVRAYPL